MIIKRDLDLRFYPVLGGCSKKMVDMSGGDEENLSISRAVPGTDLAR
ncbi:MAG TPA: hypothetical protein VMY43_08735 [Methanothrix sp.]|nr:hypothetical protein [Methanothrix sp.]